MKEYFEIIKQVLIPVFYKEDQIGRSLRRQNKTFKSELFKAILYLAQKADEGILKNEDIRHKIREISKRANVSIGQAQKTINVYLKYYCLLTGKSKKIIRELDCPLDSKIMNTFKCLEKGLRQTTLKDLNNIEEYVAWQSHLEQEGKGIRLRPDIETYDKPRIKRFLSLQ